MWFLETFGKCSPLLSRVCQAGPRARGGRSKLRVIELHCRCQPPPRKMHTCACGAWHSDVPAQPSDQDTAPARPIYTAESTPSPGSGHAHARGALASVSPSPIELGPPSWLSGLVSRDPSGDLAELVRSRGLGLPSPHDGEVSTEKNGPGSGLVCGDRVYAHVAPGTINGRAPASTS